MDTLMDFLKVLGRIYTILPLLLAAGLFMGKRSIGELPVFDFLVIITLGSLVGADIAEPKVNHFHTVGAVIAIALLQKLISYWKIKNRKIGKLLTLEPTIVVYNGQFLVKNMKKIQYSIDNVLQMLRQKDVFNVKDVEIAIIESNGELTVKLKQSKENTRLEHLNGVQVDKGVEIPVIVDGEINHKILNNQNLNEAWLRDELIKQGIPRTQDVFYAAVNKQNDLHVSLKQKKNLDNIPMINH